MSKENWPRLTAEAAGRSLPFSESPVRIINEVDNSNIDISEHVGKYRVEFGIYKRTIVPL